MQTKLTLRLENDLILRAKILAQQKGKSLSKMVSDYFDYITKSETTLETDLPPLVKSLYGSLKESDYKESDYKKYLEEKYL